MHGGGGGADFDDGDSSSAPGALAFEYVASIAVSSLAPRAARRAPRAGPTSGGTALHIIGEASRSRTSSRACSAVPRAATPPRRPSYARPTQHSAAREHSAAATMRRTPARSPLSFVIAVRRSTCRVVPCGWASLAWRGSAHSPRNQFSKQPRIMCGRLWALNTRQVITAAQRQLSHDASLVLGHAARLT